MKAVAYNTSGPNQGTLRPVELPVPEPPPGEVRVRVVRSGVNPTDVKSRRNPKTQEHPQQVPNQDGAGVIDRVGEGVDEDRIGQRVWLYHAAYLRPIGTAAEFTCVPAGHAVPLPDGITFDQGAGLGIPAMTAHRCLFADVGPRGRHVLVTGGAGAVGHAAVQFARWGGAATVVATVSTDEKRQIAEAAGADVVLNYRDADFEVGLREAARHGFDLVVDVALAANLATYLDHLNLHATAASYASGGSPLNVEVSPLTRRNVQLRFVHAYTVPAPALQQAADDINAALSTHSLDPLPLHRFALEETAAAHDACQRGAVGKVVIEVSDP